MFHNSETVSCYHICTTTVCADNFLFDNTELTNLKQNITERINSKHKSWRADTYSYLAFIVISRCLMVVNQTRMNTNKVVQIGYVLQVLKVAIIAVKWAIIQVLSILILLPIALRKEGMQGSFSLVLQIIYLQILYEIAMFQYEQMLSR